MKRKQVSGATPYLRGYASGSYGGVRARAVTRCRRTGSGGRGTVGRGVDDLYLWQCRRGLAEIDSRGRRHLAASRLAEEVIKIEGRGGAGYLGITAALPGRGACSPASPA